MITAKRAAIQNRDVFCVSPYNGGWAVEHNGEYHDASTSQEEARAAAHRRARASQDAGRPCQVTVSGETGFFGPNTR